MLASPSKPEVRSVPKLRGNPWVVLAALCLGFFMILLDTTIVNVAVPSMLAGLDASLDAVLWVVNGYVLAYAVLLITGGRLGDMFGPKLLFLAGMATFTAASVACGLADSPGQLIAGRIVQGVGGAMLTPQSLSIITRIFPADRRGAAFGVWGSVAGVAALAGPTVGGFITTHWGWQWIFFVNVPVGVAAFVFAAVVVPDVRPGRQHRLDVIGTLLVTTGLFAVTFGLIEGERYHWGTIAGPLSIGLVIGVGLVLLVAFLFVQYRDKGEPLVPFVILRDRNFSLGGLAGAAMSFGILGIFLPFTLYLQSVLGLSAQDAGLTVASMSLTSIFLSPLAGRLADTLGGKPVLTTGLVLFTAGTGYLVWAAEVGASRWFFQPGLVIAGLGMGFAFPALATVAMRDIQPRSAGAASGVLVTVRQLGGLIGSAAVGALLQVQLTIRLREAAYPDAFTGAMRSALTLAIAVLAIAAVGSLFVRGQPRRIGRHADQSSPTRIRWLVEAPSSGGRHHARAARAAARAGEA
jgi:EmrB/QacA subfamily drug resistance transporter